MQNIHYYNDTFIKETLSAWHSSKLSKYTNLRGLTMFYWLANLQTFCLSQESVWTTLWLSILCRVLLTQGFVLVGPFWTSQFLLNHRAGTHPLWVSTLSSFPGSLNCRGGLGEGLPGARKEHRFSVFKVKCNFWGLISFCLFHPHFCPVHSAWLMKIQPLFQSLSIPSFLPQPGPPRMPPTTLLNCSQLLRSTDTFQILRKKRQTISPWPWRSRWPLGERPK